MLIFIRDGDATFTLNVNAGDVIEVSEIRTSAVGRPTEQQLSKVTVGEWQSVIRGQPLFRRPKRRQESTASSSDSPCLWDTTIAPKP